MATHSSVLAWRIPGTGEPGGLPSVGSHRVGHDWSDLAAAALEHKLSRGPVFQVRTFSSERTLLVTLSDTILYYSEYINQWKRCFKHKVLHIWYCHMNSEKPTYTFIYDSVPFGRLMFLPKITSKAGLNILKIIFHASESMEAKRTGGSRIPEREEARMNGPALCNYINPWGTCWAWGQVKGWNAGFF